MRRCLECGEAFETLPGDLSAKCFSCRNRRLDRRGRHLERVIGGHPRLCEDCHETIQAGEAHWEFTRLVSIRGELRPKSCHVCRACEVIASGSPAPWRGPRGPERRPS